MAILDNTYLVNIIILSTVLCFTLYIYINRKFDYWKSKNVTFVKPIPIFGNYASFMLFKTSVGEMHKTFYDIYPDEKVVGCFKGHQPVLCVQDPELIKHVLTKDFYSFNSRGFPTDEKNEPLQKNLFNTSGDNWKVLRQNLTPLFSSAKLRNMFYLIIECTDEFERFLSTIVENNHEIDVCQVMPKFTTDVIGSCAFGLQMKSMNEKDNIFRIMGKRIFDVNYVQSLKIFLRIIAPSLFKLLKIRVTSEKVDRFFINLVKEISDSREGKKEIRHDFIDLMMDIKRKGSISGSGMESYINKKSDLVEIKVDDELMAAQSFIFFAAGFETSSTTMSFALYELANNKNIQTRAQMEIDEILKKHHGQVTYESIKEMTYLDMIISETLRKYPVLGVLNRKVTKKYRIPDSDIVIDKDVNVVIPLRGIQHDPRYYPNPELFDPQRFTPEEINKRHPYTYMPFGEGPRICIGLRFAKMQSLAGLVTILKIYSVEPTSKTEPVLTIDPRSFITTAKYGIWLKLVARNLNIGK